MPPSGLSSLSSSVHHQCASPANGSPNRDATVSEALSLARSFLRQLIKKSKLFGKLSWCSVSLNVQIFDLQTLDAQTFKQVIRARGWRTFYHRTFNFFKRIWQFCAGSFWAVRRNWKIQFEMFWISSSSLLLPHEAATLTATLTICNVWQNALGFRLSKW